MFKDGIDLSKTRLLPDSELADKLVPHRFVGVRGKFSVWESLTTHSETLAEPLWRTGEAEQAGIRGA